jgi:hypothetical protein
MSKKNDLREENKLLREVSADLKIKLILLGQKVSSTPTPTVHYKYFCEHKNPEGGSGLTRGENQQQKLEEKLKTLHKVIKNLRENMTLVVDQDGWAKEVMTEEEVLVGCLYCEGPPVSWEEIVRLKGFPHIDNDKNDGTCPWRLMEKRAMKAYERV